MLRATEVLRAGSWSAAADTVVLDHDERHRRRIAMTGEGGLSFLLDLAEAVALRGGDGLRLEDGRMVEVKAKPEPLMEVTARDQLHLVRIAWHLGNRHLPAQISGTRILIRPDHVIADMLKGLGASVRKVTLPFDPEGGAYSGGHGEHGGQGGHAHSHGHSQDHEHGHGHGHSHA
ncbi:urease accessory protein [Faunimonas pinastri]|uniref:Urease accessory protein UreE n=1 Tax=Faunimonas pinastri TaxID=1855383 RepID=A0A1H9KRR3_9HYPH|nr:urease accessory protein UreE [Faunimonas pinastri]SER01866.1 urease accessory protein [Faunimonas pinastri]